MTFAILQDVLILIVGVSYVQTNTQVLVGSAIDKVSVYSTEDQVILRFGPIQVIISPFVFVFVFNMIF